MQQLAQLPHITMEDNQNGRQPKWKTARVEDVNSYNLNELKSESKSSQNWYLAQVQSQFVYSTYLNMSLIDGIFIRSLEVLGHYSNVSGIDQTNILSLSRHIVQGSLCAPPVPLILRTLALSLFFFHLHALLFIHLGVPRKLIFGMPPSFRYATIF